MCYNIDEFRARYAEDDIEIIIVLVSVNDRKCMTGQAQLKLYHCTSPSKEGRR